MTCPKCSRESEDGKVCVDCQRAEGSRVSYLRQHQPNWIEIAEESGLALWEQQPGETQWEYTIWQAFRDAYPSKKPSYVDVAKQLNTTHNVVRKAAQRWSFQARMQAWIVECDRVTVAQRHQEMLDMNSDYIKMAAALRSKLHVAVDSVVPETLRPGEIATLLKVAADLERKAHVDSVSQEEVLATVNRDDENPNLRKSETKKDDLGHVVKILLEAGALDGITQIGVRKTTTTEVLAKKEDDIIEG